MTKNSNSKQKRVSEFTILLVSVIGISDFEFICNLVLEYWYFSGKYTAAIFYDTLLAILPRCKSPQRRLFPSDERKTLIPFAPFLKKFSVRNRCRLLFC